MSGLSTENAGVRKGTNPMVSTYGGPCVDVLNRHSSQRQKQAVLRRRFRCRKLE